MDSALKQQIVLAAYNQVGLENSTDRDFLPRVQMAAAKLAVMMQPDNFNFQRAEEAIDHIEQSKVFKGAVISVRRHRSSNRAIVTLLTGTQKSQKDAIDGDELPSGYEQVRTDFTTNAAGEEMAHAAADAVGKEVLVWVYMDQFSKGGDQLKMRVLQHFEVIGTSEHPDAVAAAKKRAERLAARAA